MIATDLWEATVPKSRRVPRWLTIVTITLVALALVFYGAGGMVFANMIHSDALTPQPPTPDNGVYVIGVGHDTITLTSRDERDDTTRPGLAGLKWDGGYGVIADISETDGFDVTRRFAHQRGTEPPICSGPLDTCEEVDIQGWTYETDPGNIPLDFEEVSFESDLGPLGAWQIDGGDGTIWAIHAHGWRASRREALRTLHTFNDAGVTSLVVDYRNDEGAPDDPTGLYRFGKTEWEDVEAAVQYAIDEGADSIVLVGYSTGAALHLAFLDNSPLADRVVAAVFDAPNIDMAETVKLGASKRQIPGTPLPVPDSLTAVAIWIADLRWDVDWDYIDYASRSGEIVEVPTLVFHGLNDERVPIEVSERFRDGAPALIELVEVPDAGHVTSWNVGSAAYERKLAAFLDETT